MNKFASNLKFIRKHKQLTKKEMAKKLNVSYSTYANYEYGNREPNLDVLIKISTLLEFSIDSLLTSDLKEVIKWA